MNNEVFIYDVVRIPTGKKGGYYKHTLMEEATAFLINKLIERNAIEGKKVEVLLGNSIGTMGNMARYASLLSNLPQSTVATTLDLQCGGSYQALRLGSGLIKAGENQVILAGGLESNSLRPARFYNNGDPRKEVDGDIQVAAFDPDSSISLNDAAGQLAIKYGITKEELFNWTLRSHQKAFQFSKSEAYSKYILDCGKGEFDQTIRPGLSLSQLKRVEEDSLIDRTNTAHYHDGAALALLSDKSFSVKSGIKPMAKVVDSVLIGIDPKAAPEGAIIAAEVLLKQLNLQVEDIDLFEINESFGAKPLAYMKHFGIKSDEVINVLGGNLAFGHPYGASGLLNLMHLILALKQKNRRFGLLSAGVAGGFGAAILLENIV